MTEIEINVAQHIEKISDPAVFEKLIIRSLDIIDPEYGQIFHTGVNPEGKTIRCPVDGICYITNSSPPKLFLLACTTYELDNIEKKWLFDSSTLGKITPKTPPDGDLIKIKNWAIELKAEDPDIQITAILATNRSLYTETHINSIITPVHKIGIKFNINVILIDQGKLKRNLIDSQKGHWLLKEFFNISPNLFSQELFRDVSYRNITQYATQFQVPNNLIKRDISKDIYSNAFNKGHVIQLITSKSGYGKTTIAHQCLVDYHRSGKNAIWISAKDYDDYKNLTESLVHIIRRYYPDLTQIEDSLDLIINPNNPILITIDDIGTSDNPSLLLGSIIHRVEQMEENKQKFPFRILIPINSQNLLQISIKYRENILVHTLDIPQLSDIEGIQIIQNHFHKLGNEITKEESLQICKKLSFDPYLINLFCDMNITRIEDYSDSTILSEYIRFVISNIASKNQIFSDYQLFDCMKCLVEYCIEIKNFEPMISDLQNIPSHTPLFTQIINLICADEKICKISDTKIKFRHERIIISIASSIFEKWFQTNSIQEHISVISDPYFSKYISIALLTIELQQEDAEWLIKNNPFIFFSFLLNLKDPLSIIDKRYVDLIIGWIKSEYNKDDTPKFIWETLHRTLMEMNYTPFVKQVINIVQIDQITSLAGIKHGSALHGIHFCKCWKDFEPHFTNPLRDRVIEYALRYNPSIVTELGNILTFHDISDKERRGALAFAGHLADPVLEKQISICWEKTNNKDELITEALWAVINCSSNSPSESCDDILYYWSKFSHDNDNHTRLSEVDEIADQIRMALSQKRKISLKIINYLIQISNRIETLKQTIFFYILPYINNPVAIEAVLNHFLVSFHFTSQIHLIEIWDKTRGYTDQKLSEDSLFLLKSYWEDNRQNDKKRILAFRLWLTGSSVDDLETLQGISRDSPLYRYSCEKRAIFGDLSLNPDIYDLIQLNSNLFYLLPDIWTPSVSETISKFIRNHCYEKGSDVDPEHYLHLISYLMMHIPSKDAEQILYNNWSIFEKNKRIIQVSLYIGTQFLTQLVDKSLEYILEKDIIFENISFNYHGEYNGRARYLNDYKLSVIKKYLPFFSQSELERFAAECIRVEYYLWAENNIKPLLDEKIATKLFLSDDILISIIDNDDFCSKDYVSKYWVVKREFNNNIQNPKIRARVLTIFSIILEKYRSEENLKFIQLWFSIHGKRNDLIIFDNIHKLNSSDKKYLENIRTMTKYNSID